MIERSPFGEVDGRPVEALELIAKNGMRAKLITYGARLTELHVPDRNGRLDDIVLGFDDIESYISTNTYFGATCGRYGNRIGRGTFPLMGETIRVDVNEGANHLHGGKAGFDRKIWRSEVDEAANRISFTALSEDGEMGFPGRAELRADYLMGEDGRLEITMSATTDKLTVMNMVHHSYFNLAGHGSGNVLDQHLRLNAGYYTPVDAELMTTGEVLSVAGTPFDFREAKAIGRDIAALEAVGAGVFEEGGGYDHNWCLDGAGVDLRPCAEAYDPESGRRMTLETSEPGVQFYTGGYLSEQVVGKGGRPYCKYAGYTLETQKFPDAPNMAHFPDCLLRPGETYRQTMRFRFRAD